MRAAVLRNTGDEKLEIVDGVEPNPPGPTDVTVKIEATGVCHSDLHAMDGKLPQGAPFVPGHEGAGIITEVGDQVTDLKVGDHVVVAWSPPCGQCNNCVERNQPHLCVMIQFAIAGLPRFKEGDTDLFGMAGTGTFAEYLTLPQEAAIKIDDDVPFEIASLIGCGVSTGVGAAINTAKVQPGSKVVVFGCGGVGISVIQGAKVAGASVIVAVDLVEGKRRNQPNQPQGQENQAGKGDNRGQVDPPGRPGSMAIPRPSRWRRRWRASTRPPSATSCRTAPVRGWGTRSRWPRW